MSGWERGLKSWRPDAETQPLLDDLLAVIEEERTEWPIGIRSIEYLMLARGYVKDRCRRTDLPLGRNSQKAEKPGALYITLKRAVGRARRAGMIPWHAIEDAFHVADAPVEFTDADDFWSNVRGWADGYQRVRLEGQSVIPELWVEARGMVTRCTTIAHEYGVEVHSSGGDSHLGAKYRLARRVDGRAQQGQTTVVFHVGDHDKKGRDIFQVTEDDVRQMVIDLGGFGDTVRFERLAVTTDQAWQLHEQGKSQGVDRYGLPEVQAEAIPPHERTQMIRAAIEGVLDLDGFHGSQEQSENDKATILTHLDDLIGGS
jgi:hypothetical protein